MIDYNPCARCHAPTTGDADYCPACTDLKADPVRWPLVCAIRRVDRNADVDDLGEAELRTLIRALRVGS